MFLRRLEPRIVLDAALAGGTVSIDGTPGDDVILVRGEPVHIVVELNGSTQLFPADAVKRLVINGLGGDDLIENATRRPATLAGGAGRDTLVGGNGNDSLLPGGQAGEIVRPRHGQDTVTRAAGLATPLLDFAAARSGLYEIRTSASDGQIFHPDGTVALLAAEGEYFFDVRLTDGGDTARLSADGNQEAAGSFIAVDLGSGNDRLAELSASFAGVLVNAGPGDDDLRHAYVGVTNGQATLHGGGGDDTIPNHPNYILTPGTGVDTVEWAVDTGDPQAVLLNMGFERYVITSQSPVRLRNGDGSRHIDVRGALAGATVLAGGGDDTVIASDADDILVGGDGNDVVDYAHRFVPIDGRIEFADSAGEFELSRVISGSERDELRGFEALVGTQGNDMLAAKAVDGRSIRLEGRGGRDDLVSLATGGGVGVTLVGGTGNDTLTAEETPAQTIIEAGRGDDTIIRERALFPNAGEVHITGGAGRDTVDDRRTFVNDSLGRVHMPDAEVWLAPIVPRILGSDRDDVIILRGDRSSPAAELPRIVHGNGGSDLVDCSALDGRITAYGEAGDDTIFGTASFDQLFGDDGNDSIDGGRGFDRVFGGPGNDTLTGGRDGDSVDGGAGDDLLIGGPRADRLFGGDGNDRFRIAGGGIDTADGGAGDDTLESGDAEDVMVSVEVLPQ